MKALSKGSPSIVPRTFTRPLVPKYSAEPSMTTYVHAPLFSPLRSVASNALSMLLGPYAPAILIAMQIRSRMSTSIDGYITTPTGWPALTADPAFVSGQGHGIQEFLSGCEAALMGRVTFEPALNNERWPWPDLDVFVLASGRPPGTPDHVVVDSDPERLLERMREANRGGDVHLI